MIIKAAPPRGSKTANAATIPAPALSAVVISLVRISSLPPDPDPDPDPFSPPELPLLAPPVLPVTGALTVCTKFALQISIAAICSPIPVEPSYLVCSVHLSPQALSGPLHCSAAALEDSWILCHNVSLVNGAS